MFNYAASEQHPIAGGGYPINLMEKESAMRKRKVRTKIVWSVLVMGVMAAVVQAPGAASPPCPDNKVLAGPVLGGHNPGDDTTASPRCGETGEVWVCGTASGVNPCQDEPSNCIC